MKILRLDLDKGAYVTHFEIGDHLRIEKDNEVFELKFEMGELEIRSVDRSLSILPKASNTIILRKEKY